MAVLPDGDRVAVAAEFGRAFEVGESCAVTKPDIRAAVNALDDWFDANAATLNAALPAAFRAGATQRQKARLMQFVLQRRYGRA
jgi:hypothetical protein